MLEKQEIHGSGLERATEAPPVAQAPGKASRRVSRFLEDGGKNVLGRGNSKSKYLEAATSLVWNIPNLLLPSECANVSSPAGENHPPLCSSLMGLAAGTGPRPFCSPDLASDSNQ